MGRALHGPLVDAGRQRNRPDHLGARALDGLDDLRDRLVQDPIVKALEPDADPLIELDRHTLLYPVPFCPYARMSVTMPEPTVLPPSRIAKRSPWSIAIGEISSAVIVTLSPAPPPPPPAPPPPTPPAARHPHSATPSSTSTTVAHR